jgi:DNA-directed RNA polymerase alpha subunit
MNLIDEILEIVELDGRSELIMKLRYRKPIKTYEQIAKDFDLTRERIRQIEQKAIRMIVNKLKSNYELNKVMKQEKSIDTKVDKPMDSVDITIFCMSVDYLELSARAGNCLKIAGIETVDDLIKLTERDLRKMRNCGEVTIKEIKMKLSKYNLYLKGCKQFP